MWTLTDEAIDMMKRDASLNHEAALVNFNRYKEILSSSDFRNKVDYMKEAIVSAKSDFENAMNLYATVSLYREEYTASIASKMMCKKCEIIFKHLLDLEKGVISDGD